MKANAGIRGTENSHPTTQERGTPRDLEPLLTNKAASALPNPRRPVELFPVWRNILWSEIIPGISFESKLPVELPTRPIWNGKLMLYLSAEARVRVTVFGQSQETVKLGFANGKWDLEIKTPLNDVFAAKLRINDGKGKFAIEWDGRILKVEGEVQVDPLKPVSVNFTAPSFRWTQVDLGEGVKARIDVLEVKIKAAFGPGPLWTAEATRLLVRSGPAGIVVLAIVGAVAGTGFIANVVEAAKASGLAHKRKVAYRAGYVWRVASESSGDRYERKLAVGHVEDWRGDLSDAAVQGWDFAGDVIRRIPPNERMGVMRELRLRYGNMIERMAQALLVRIGGYKDDERQPPADLRELLQ